MPTKLTESYLRSIIKEELKIVLKEGFFDFFKKKETKSYEEAKQEAIAALEKEAAEAGYEGKILYKGKPAFSRMEVEFALEDKIKQLYPNIKVPRSDAVNQAMGKAQDARNDKLAGTIMRSQGLPYYKKY